jgi:hypothetical protein
VQNYVKTAVFHRLWVKKAFIGEKKGCGGCLWFVVFGLWLVVGGW